MISVMELGECREYVTKLVSHSIVLQQVPVCSVDKGAVCKTYQFRNNHEHVCNDVKKSSLQLWIWSNCNIISQKRKGRPQHSKSEHLDFKKALITDGLQFQFQTKHLGSYSKNDIWPHLDDV